MLATIVFDCHYAILITSLARASTESSDKAAAHYLAVLELHDFLLLFWFQIPEHSRLFLLGARIRNLLQVGHCSIASIEQLILILVERMPREEKTYILLLDLEAFERAHRLAIWNLWMCNLDSIFAHIAKQTILVRLLVGTESLTIFHKLIEEGLSLHVLAHVLLTAHIAKRVESTRKDERLDALAVDCSEIDTLHKVETVLEWAILLSL